MFLHALSGADEARKRYAESGRQAFPRQSFSGADESRKRYAVAGLGEFRALRSAGTVSKRIDTPYGGFYPLGTPSSALLGRPRSDGTQAFLLRGGTEKGERQYRYRFVGSA